MSTDTRCLGRIGENAAAVWLETQGYRIVGRNVYAAGMEADLLAENDSCFVFVEVKTRRSRPDSPDRFGRPARNVTDLKKSHMLTMAMAYLREHPEILESRSPRLDVIEVYLDPATNTVLEICHIPDAVRPKGNYARAARTGGSNPPRRKP